MKRTVGAVMCLAGVALAVASIGFVFTWPLGMLMGAGLVLGGATLTRNPEEWLI